GGCSHAAAARRMRPMRRWEPRADRPFRLDQIGLILVFLTLPLEGVGLLSRAGGTVAGGITIAKLLIIVTLGTWFVRALVVGDRFPLYALTRRTTLILMGSLIVAFSTVVNAYEREYFGQVFVQLLSLFLL